MFIDVGANVGQTLLDYCAAASGAGYLGFEPNPLCSSHLASIIEKNTLEDCRVIPAGLSDANGVAELLLEDLGDAEPAATMISDLRPGRIYRSVLICCLRFDDLAASIVNGPIALMKIDVEGAELLALRGMKRTLREQ